MHLQAPNEKPLIFAILYTMDGNDSLKRICRRMQDDEGIPGMSCEHIDTRTIGGDFYLVRQRWTSGQSKEYQK